jgi:hypothetical protein
VLVGRRGGRSPPGAGRDAACGITLRRKLEAASASPAFPSPEVGRMRGSSSSPPPDEWPLIADEMLSALGQSQS